MNPSVIREVDSELGFATLTLNRPDRLNSLSNNLLESLAQELATVAGEDSIRAVILTGSGRAFCSGADTDEMHGGDGGGPHKPGTGGAEELRRGFRLAQKVILGIHKMEKPVIATDVGGDGEMMIDKKTGFLVKEGNAEEIIQRLSELLKDTEFATKMGKEGAKFVKQEFNWEKVTRNFLDIVKPHVNQK